ncbi:MAG: IreB family regulatory phosphoprotein [Defluviitaleaceae bacterium]|nr:IreB family regulatory phosphoprotein [Defluviitaleaceae bacterium]
MMNLQDISKNLSQTQKISTIGKEGRKSARDILLEVSDALMDKGYDPVIQIVGYILSGDPTYITAHRNARSLIGRLERDELLDEVIKFYLENN